MSRPYLQCGRCLGVNAQGEILLCSLPMKHEREGHWNPAFTGTHFGDIELYPGLTLSADGQYFIVVENCL
jgi:hypothetical protein